MMLLRLALLILIVLRRRAVAVVLRQHRGGEQREQRGRTQQDLTHLDSPWRGVNGKGTERFRACLSGQRAR
jgi:hypothetical protein